MNQTVQKLVHFFNNRLVTTSLDIAQNFGKKHAHVLRDIENLECSQSFRESNFGLSSYISNQNKELPMYEITRDGFVFLCMGFTGASAAY
ncbi:Rha family transcriptional regulator [Kingella kingae]|uniref:Rha family transcriptional regulator n=1 Tax=Kingella kingae TaxID=504 RepID=UPI00255780AC|nr:Rha family transcriptional regulator [Kingella kingae]MDK4624193.1 Rha family transcriptional regulator [Kingella kingae]MDK4659772.1 Rha family transcriptional regulator [Kingella kingae]MDK4667764.1 Rha family transcriptional regulator [Kingella kingae]MDK4686126.1 Rha family transcriptional regulator [Kingella kingae]